MNAFICHRVESRLEGFHEPLSHFANTNMSSNLADILNLIGTSKYNCNVRQKLSIANMRAEERKEIPSHCLLAPKHYNHCELLIVNNNAKLLGLEPPFRDVQILPPDNGERFFSAYLLEQKSRNLNVTPHFNNDRCQCESCANNSVQLMHEIIAPTIYNEDIAGVSTNDVAIGPPKKKRARTKKDFSCDVKTIQTTTIEEIPAMIPSARPNIWNPRMYQQHAPPFMYQQPHPSVYLNMWQPWGQAQYPQCSQVPFSNFSAPAVPAVAKKKNKKLQTEICCLKYAIWLNKPDRHGRPPHDIENCLRTKK
jgi:hypothetical protein